MGDSSWWIHSVSENAHSTIILLKTVISHFLQMASMVSNCLLNCSECH